MSRRGPRTGTGTAEARGAAATTSAPKTDHDVLRESFRFIRSEDDDADPSWEQRHAKRYHDKLFKEYCLADMSRYKEGKIGMRWRTEREVLEGKGQLVCGSKGCEQRAGLHSFEVNFAYIEGGVRKQALVKLRICPKHAGQLNYRKEKEMRQKRRAEEREERRQQRRKKRKGSKGKEASGSSESDEGSDGGPHRHGGRELRHGKRGWREGGGEAWDASLAEQEQPPQQRGLPGGLFGASEQQAEGGAPEVGAHSGAECAALNSNPHQGATQGGDVAAAGESEGVWAPQQAAAEASKDEEFDRYFEDLLA